MLWYATLLIVVLLQTAPSFSDDFSKDGKTTMNESEDINKQFDAMKKDWNFKKDFNLIKDKLNKDRINKDFDLNKSKLQKELDKFNKGFNKFKKKDTSGNTTRPPNFLIAILIVLGVVGALVIMVPICRKYCRDSTELEVETITTLHIPPVGLRDVTHQPAFTVQIEQYMRQHLDQDPISLDDLPPSFNEIQKMPHYVRPNTGMNNPTYSPETPPPAYNPDMAPKF